MHIFQTFILYLYSVLDHWLFSFGGIALVTFALYEKYRQKITPNKWFWGLAALCIFVATFQAWSDAYQKRKEGAVYLIPDEPRLVAGGVALSPVWFPVGKSPQVNLVWAVFGKDPALNIREDITCFIVNDLTVSVQESTINDFIQKWASQ